MTAAAWVRKAAAEAARARLQRARAAVREAAAAKRSAVSRARQTCSAARVATREWVARARLEVRAEVERLRLELREHIAAKRAAVRACCGPDKARARAEADERIAAARAALEQLRGERKTERIWSKREPLKPAQRRQRAREQKAETDHDLEADLSPDELIVWRAVRTRIAPASARMSKLEGFRHWLHDHQGEVARLLEQDAQRQYAAAVKREKEERAQLAQFRRTMRKASDRELRDYVVAELDAPVSVASDYRALSDARKAENRAQRAAARANSSLRSKLLNEAVRRGKREIDWLDYFRNLGILDGLTARELAREPTAGGTPTGEQARIRKHAHAQTIDTGEVVKHDGFSELVNGEGEVIARRDHRSHEWTRDGEPVHFQMYARAAAVPF
jgi:hypothetical protein